MNLYPYTYPIIMDDATYLLYGGKTGTLSDVQRELAYRMAEMQVSSYIGTFLLPTTVTGTYTTVPTKIQRISTDYGYVHSIDRVAVRTQKVTESNGCELVDVDGCAFIYSDTFGYLDVHKLRSSCGCGSNDVPYLYEITYTAGLPTGAANHPNILAALTIMTTINLNELYPGVIGMNESPGDVAIQEWESFGYHERRSAHSLKRTALGGSAMANKAANLIDSCVRKVRKSLRI